MNFFLHQVQSKFKTIRVKSPNFLYKNFQWPHGPSGCQIISPTQSYNQVSQSTGQRDDSNNYGAFDAPWFTFCYVYVVNTIHFITYILSFQHNYSLIQFSQATVEKKLSQMILDKKFHGEPSIGNCLFTLKSLILYIRHRHLVLLVMFYCLVYMTRPIGTVMLLTHNITTYTESLSCQSFFVDPQILVLVSNLIFMKNRDKLMGILRKI